MSKFHHGVSITTQLRSLGINECFVVALKAGITQDRIMRNTTAVCVKLGIKITQSGFRGLALDCTNDQIINLVLVTRIS